MRNTIELGHGAAASMAAVVPTGVQPSRLGRLGREFFWVAVGQVVAAAGGVAGVRLLTGALSPSSYGELALGMTAATLVQQSIMGPLSQACLRYFGPAQESCRLELFLGSAWRLLKEASLAIAAVAVVTVLLLALGGEAKWGAFAGVAFALALASGCNGTVDSVQTAARQRLVVAWHQSLLQWLRPALALALIAMIGATSVVALLGYVLASLAVLVSQVVTLRKQIRLSVRSLWPAREGTSDLAAQMRAYAWPFSLWGVVTWLQLASDRWALQIFHDAHAVGVYAAVYQLGYYPMVLVSSAVGQLVAPVLFTRAGDGSDASRLAGALRLNQAVVVCSLLATILGVATALVFHRALFTWLVGPAYRPGSVYLPWLVLAGGLFASGQTASLMLMTGATTHVLIIPKMVTAIGGAFLSLAGARFLGVGGVVWASVVFGASYCVWILLVATRYDRAIHVARRSVDR